MMKIKWWTKPSCKKRFIVYDGNRYLPQITVGCRKVETPMAGSQTAQYITCYFLCFQRRKYLSYLSKTAQRCLWLLGSVDLRGAVNMGFFRITGSQSSAAKRHATGEEVSGTSPSNFKIY